jgi:hypothetical protein
MDRRGSGSADTNLPGDYHNACQAERGRWRAARWGAFGLNLAGLTASTMSISTRSSLHVLLQESPFQHEHAAVAAAGSLPEGEWLAEALLARTPRVMARRDCPRGDLTWESATARADTAAGAALVSAAGHRWREEAAAGALYQFSDMGQALISLRWGIVAGEAMPEEELDALRTSLGAGIVLEQQNHLVPKLPCEIPREGPEPNQELLLHGVVEGKVAMAGALAATATGQQDVRRLALRLLEESSSWVRTGQPNDLCDVHLLTLGEAIVFLTSCDLPPHRTQQALAQYAAYVAWYRNERLDAAPLVTRPRAAWWDEHVAKLEAPQWRTRIVWIHRVKLLAAARALRGQIDRNVEGSFQRALDLLEQMD